MSHAGVQGSLSQVLALVASGRARSRTEISKATGLARSTVTNRVAALVGEGLLVEHQVGPSSGGRPPIELRLNADAGLVLGADIGATHLRVAVADLSGAVLAEHSSDLLIAAGPAVVMPRVLDVMLELLVQVGHVAGDVRGLGIGVPGPVQFRTGTVVRPPIMPGWDGVRLTDHLAPVFDAPVLVDNDVNLMALGEFGARHLTPRLLLFIRVGTGIGCGIVDDGRVLRGVDGAAGDIGHIHLPDAGQVRCSCGNLGCVEAVASGAAMARTLTELGVPASSSADVVSLVQNGNTPAKQVVRQASVHIGSLVATLVNCYNPSTVVLGGPLAPLNDDLLAGVRAVVYQRATPLATRSLVVEGSQLDERAGVVGALTLVRDHLLSLEGLATLLHQRS